MKTRSMDIRWFVVIAYPYIRPNVRVAGVHSATTMKNFLNLSAKTSSPVQAGFILVTVVVWERRLCECDIGTPRSFFVHSPTHKAS